MENSKRLEALSDSELLKAANDETRSAMPYVRELMTRGFAVSGYLNGADPKYSRTENETRFELTAKKELKA